jgi:hypothetical protein
MRVSPCLAIILILAISSPTEAKKSDHDWFLGKVLDQNRARYFAGFLHNSSSQTTANGSWNGTANSTSIGDSTNTQMNGGYSGTATTSTTGATIPMYRVYDYLVIEGPDTVYFTSERLRWRWSKGAHVAVNGTVKYYVDHRKLHLLDDDGKEYSIEIVKEVRKAASIPAATPSPTLTSVTAQSPAVTQVSVAIDSTPADADIEVDGAFVGNTPSTLALGAGNHLVAVKKKGFTDWSKTLTVAGGNIHIKAELEPAPQ